MKKISAIVLGIVFIAKNTVSKFLGAGTHLVTIDEVIMDEAKGDGSHKDLTPQLKITFRGDNDRKFTAWYNLKGYRKYDELSEKEKKSNKFKADNSGYAIDAKSLIRLENVENTKAAQSIVGRVALDCGFDENVEFEAEDLAGKELGIVIAENEQGNLRIKFTMPASKVEAKGEDIAG